MDTVTDTATDMVTDTVTVAITRMNRDFGFPVCGGKKNNPNGI